MQTKNDIFDLTGMIAIVTGSTGHLGKAISFGLAEKGAKVILQGRSKDKVEKLYQEMKLEKFDVDIAIFDVKNESEIKNYFSEFKHPQLDILVNNAYSGKLGSIETSTSEDFNDSYHTAVTSSFMMMKYSLPHMRDSITHYRSIINIGSMYGMVSPDLSIYESEEVFNPPFYGAAKAGLIQLTKYAAANLAKYKIRVNSISPGPFPNSEAQKNEKLLSGINRHNLFGRPGKPSELKGPIVFLASPASSYVTGANIVVDGGWTSR